MRSTAPASARQRLSGEALFRSGPAAPLVPGAEHVAPYRQLPLPLWHLEHRRPSGEACARMIEYVLEREGDIAALIAEPMRAVPYVPPPGFWARVRAACDRHGTLLIFDEIPSGPRQDGHACSPASTRAWRPDMLVLGKALGGGILPIAAVLARPELDVGADWAFGHYTHEKNPVTTRAALTTIEIIEDEGLVENAARVGAVALARLHEMKSRIRRIGDVRGRGLLLGIELVRDRASKEPDNELAEAVHVRRARPRAVVQDHHRQRADPDAAAHRHRGADAAGARHHRRVNRGCSAWRFDKSLSSRCLPALAQAGVSRDPWSR